MFSKAGITEWVSTSFAPYLEPLFSNIFVLIIASVLIIAILRFAFVSQTALMTIFTVASAPFAIVAGMHPFIPGFIALVTVNVFNTSYHNGTFITTMAGFRPDGRVQAGPRNVRRLHGSLHHRPYLLHPHVEGLRPDVMEHQ